MARVDRLGAALVLALSACPAPNATTAPHREAPEPAHEVLPDVAFDKLDLAQRAVFMKQKVIPAMAPLFATRGKQLMCETCHGKPVDGHYRMPNPALPKLGDDLSRFKPDDVQWMAKEIKPTMAKLLDRPEFSADTPTGFGCSVCHTLEP